MYGLNPFQPEIDPIELLKVRGLLGSTFAQPPMAPQPGMAINPVGHPIPGQPQDYNDARNDTGNFQAQVTPAGQQMLPPIDIGRPPSPDQPPMQVPMPPRRPESFGPEGGLPSLVGQPMPNMGPESATPEQRQMAASSAGKPQDVRPNDPISGFDSGLDKMMTDPLFNMGIALLANPRNIGQGLASGLQNWPSASRQAKRDKLAEEASKRKNIHWQVINGQLVGADLDNPNAPVIIPGGQPQKQMFETIEQDGAKYQRDPDTGRLFPLQTPDQPDKYEPVLDESGNPIAQRNLKTGRVEADPRVKNSSPEAKYSERQAQGQAMGLEGEELRQFTLTGKYKPAGAAGPEKITEGQAKDAAFATRMKVSDNIIGDPEAIAEAASKLKGGYESAVSGIPVVGNMVISDRYRKLDQAKRDFINAALRRESGAMISPAEFENGNRQYFPQPGDDPITIENKRLNRITAMEGVAYGGAPSFRKQFFGEDAPDIARRALERQQESERKRSGATGSVQAAPQIDRDAAIAEARRRGLIK